MPDAQSRRQALAARMVGLAASLPEGDPLRQVGEAAAPRRLKTTTGWREVGAAALTAADAQGVPVEARLHHTLPRGPSVPPSSSTWTWARGPDAQRRRQ